jgi:hypothetical protein
MPLAVPQRMNLLLRNVVSRRKSDAESATPPATSWRSWSLDRRGAKAAWLSAEAVAS